MALWPHLSYQASEETSLSMRGTSACVLGPDSPSGAKLEPPWGEDTGNTVSPPCPGQPASLLLTVFHVRVALPPSQGEVPSEAPRPWPGDQAVQPTRSRAYNSSYQAACSPSPLHPHSGAHK